MKSTTATTVAMSDEALEATERTLTKRIPADQALLSAVRMERRRRRNRARAAQGPDQTSKDTE